ncbi:MAG: fatty-acid oxidation protein subunit alpha [Candidatus Marinimicrobia bacterium]|nr:fatty-acid oxidation protein subunit alpha [Candidatus Neomarinimicrobiota bacterium]|tara:strand:- start:1248 stop:1673 length:426 start_codon:yes stop_codon:yes gene_type:complete
MNKLKNCKNVKLKQIIDSHDGILSIAEEEKHIPFKIKRVYYIYGFESQKSIRGYHSHKALKQVLFCISGTVSIVLDDGINKATKILENPNEGIYIGENVWHTMQNFSEDCIILVFASNYYDESDYIRNYDDFIMYVKRKNL